MGTDDRKLSAHLQKASGGVFTYRYKAEFVTVNTDKNKYMYLV